MVVRSMSTTLLQPCHNLVDQVVAPLYKLGISAWKGGDGGESGGCGVKDKLSFYCCLSCTATLSYCYKYPELQSSAFLSLTCEFAEGSTAELCFFNFTGINTEPPTFLVNRTVNSSDALSCAMANAVVDKMNYM